jgi:hypothetical protein
MENTADADGKSAHAAALAHIRKESLDLYNRIHSIAEDVAFVAQVYSHFQRLPILRAYRSLKSRITQLKRFCVYAKSQSSLRCLVCRSGYCK